MQRVTGFKLGSLPVTYLGLPLSANKWSKSDCKQLIDKLTVRLKLPYARILSYAGKIQLIISILFSIQNYWSMAFILPVSVTKAVDRICRDFLWGASTNDRKFNLVSWKVVCCPKKFGGLNLHDNRIWNTAATGKLVWQLAIKKDNLWIKWVHGFYMKNDASFWEHSPKMNSSWYWRELNKKKSQMAPWYLDSNSRIKLVNGKYSISEAYVKLLGPLQKWKVSWLVWNKLALPRHRFIAWLAAQGRLLTRDCLMKMGYKTEAVCILCCDDALEDHRHLFCSCSWTVVLYDLVK